MNQRFKFFRYSVSLAVASAALLLLSGWSIFSSPDQCDDLECMAAHFADCKPAVYEGSGGYYGRADDQAQYRIEGVTDNQCKVSIKYLKSASEWQDKSLVMHLDNTERFLDGIRNGVEYCVFHDDPGAYECSGELAGAGMPGVSSHGPDLLPGLHQALLPAIAADAPQLFPVEVDEQWGYIDRSGTLVIAPQYQQADDFHEGLAAVQVDGLYGFINTDGDVVIDPQFASVNHFSDGLVAVQPEGEERMGFANRQGEVVIPATFGNYYQFYAYSRFVDGLAPAVDYDSMQFGYIDKQGEWVIQPQFDNARQFAAGMAPVQVGSTWQFIDKTGQTVLEGDWSDARPFAEGLAAVNTSGDSFDGEWSYIDKHGEPAVIPVFGIQRDSGKPDDARSFSEGVAAVYHDGPGKWEYILPVRFGTVARTITYKKGAPTYEQAESFRGGLARVKPEQQTGSIYIDRQGNQVWPPE